MPTTAKAAILHCMGSKNDLPKLQPAIDAFAKLGVPTTVRVMSA